MLKFKMYFLDDDAIKIVLRNDKVDFSGSI